MPTLSHAFSPVLAPAGTLSLVAQGAAGGAGRSVLAIFLGLVLLAAVVLIAVFVLNYGRIWLQAFMSNVPMNPLNLVFMSLRQVQARVIVDGRIQAMQAGVGQDAVTGINTKRLEAHYLAGGNVPRVINAIVAAHRADIDLDFDRAAAIDLAGRDVLEAVKTSVYPKVIDCPDPDKAPKSTLSAVAKDGVELKVRARVTVRTNLKQLIGGATEDTIIARVGEGIITAIGSAQDHLAVMENPDRISRAVLDRGLDAQTAYEIVSIDIADIDIGENIGARLKADQAEADTRRAQAAAEKRRADAIAREQEMKAQVASKRGEVVEAESEVPRAISDAFRAGNLATLPTAGPNGAG
ncbi:MAG: flotillin-like protein FloA [Planctomycetota bacterium]